MSKPFWSYILRCGDGSFYTGHTDDLERRVNEHRSGEFAGYTKNRRPVTLVWTQEFDSRESALNAELQIKKWSTAKKEALVSGKWADLSEAARKRDWAGYRRRRKGRDLR